MKDSVFAWILVPRFILNLALMLWALPGMRSTVLGQNSRIEQGQITSDALTNNLYGDKASRPFTVYLPPSYDSTQQRYPVVYVLHGYGMAPSDMLGILRSPLDSMTRARTVGELIVVFVDGSNRLYGSFYLNSPVIGDYETYIAKDLVAHIDTHYRTLPTRESRGITGYSMGGWGAMHLGLKFPGTFSVVVAEAGVYDAVGKFVDGLNRQLAYAHPTNLVQFDNLAFPVNAAQALLAGLLPNVQRPQLFTDCPYELVNKQIVTMDAAQQRCRDGDILHGDLGRYAQQATFLKAIKIVHGTGDGVVPISEARAFTNALTVAGIEFSYQEHSGGHDYLPQLALPFLSTNVVGTQLYIAPPQVTLARTPASLQLSFVTQKGVVYSVDSSFTLGGPNSPWIDKVHLTGDGQLTKIGLPMEGNGEFFRVRAANPAR